jgi:cell division protein FtsZ
MADNLFTVEEESRQNIVSIKVIGVGGGGSNMVNYMVREGLKGVDMIVANTDAQALATSLAAHKLQLGQKLTRGLGAGMKPEIGRDAAEESYEQIRETLKGADLVFIATGLGGGTGTGASGVVARAAKENGSLTIAVCTKPFGFEGPKRNKLANQGYEDLKINCDSMVVIPNDKLMAVVEKSMGYAESFSMVDSVLARAVRGISSIVLPNGVEGINTDFADLSTVMSHRGMALMGMGHSHGADAAYEALKDAIESPLLDNLSIDGAMGVLVHFQIHPDYPLVAINRAMQVVYDSADEDADVIFGTSVDDTFEPEEAKVTIIATGFEREVANNEIEMPRQEEEPPARTRAVNRTLKVSGGYDVNEEMDLDTPTFIRRQLD